MSDLRVFVQGLGLLGPGLSSWAVAREVLRGNQPHVQVPTVLPPPARLPAAERRRAGTAVKLAMAVADEAVTQAGIDPGSLATVFTSSSGEGSNCHALSEALSMPSPVVSPTRFTNSVHNASSGAWHIAVASRAPSTSLAAFDGSFGAGLIEAAIAVRASGEPILLVASDSPYPEPLHSARPLPDHFGIAMLLTPTATPQSLASMTIMLTGPQTLSVLNEDSLDALSRSIPAAAGLPLLGAIARAESARLAIKYLPSMGVRVDVQPLPAASS
jgi:hypothetical protein